MKKTIKIYEKLEDIIPLFTREITINKRELDKSEDKHIFIAQAVHEQIIRNLHIEYK